MRASDPRPSTEQATALSREISKVFVRYIGRGPGKVRSTVALDVVCVVMHDSLTKGEHTLLAAGEHDLVLQVRRAYLAAMESSLTAVTEAITGRDVVAFHSDHSNVPDLSTVNLVLAPLEVPIRPALRPVAAGSTAVAVASGLAVG